MKTPRVTDFDPNAKVPQLKSSLESMPIIGKPKPINQPPLSSHAKRSKPPKPPRLAITQSAKRAFIRRTFDFYEDQIEYLKRESLQKKLAGKEAGMNSMIREAIDDWITKRTSKK